MIELKKIQSDVMITGERRELFDLLIDDEIIAGIFGERLDSGKVNIQLEEPFKLEELLETSGDCHIATLVCHEKKPLPFFISDFSLRKDYYNWKKIFLGCLQELRINGSGVSGMIGLSFCLFADDLPRWTYAFPKNIFYEASRINHNKVNIVTKEKLDHISFQIDLRKEFTTTLNASYEELKKAIYEVEQELYERLENPK